jgi:signal transduction histidine kinase
MNIRIKLTFQFTLLVAIILLFFTTGVYYFSAWYRDNDYTNRLQDRANTAAKLLLKVEEVDGKLLKIIDQNTLSLYQDKIYAFNEQGDQIYTNRDDTTYNGSPILKQVLEKKVVKFKEGDRDAIGIRYNYGKKYCVVIASAYDFYGFSKLKNLKIILISGYFITLILTILVGLFFAGRALSPISDVVSQVKNITISNLNLRVDEGNKKDEIAQLAITFNQMLERLEQAFLLQRDFVSNAAHELRTPFTVMLTEIDYNLMNDRTKEQYKNTLINVSQELIKLSKLSNGLLDLARISFENTKLELKSVRLYELLLDTCNDYSFLNKEYKINVNFSELPEDDSFLYVFGNEQLIKLAIKNLIENGCKFSEQKAVDITFTSNSNFLDISFADKGIGIPKEDIENIFQPFYRGKNSHFIAGYGLGLALTKKIIDLHNGKIQVTSETGYGSVFSIEFPVNYNS